MYLIKFGLELEYFIVEKSGFPIHVKQAFGDSLTRDSFPWLYELRNDKPGEYYNGRNDIPKLIDELRKERIRVSKFIKPYKLGTSHGMYFSGKSVWESRLVYKSGKPIAHTIEDRGDMRWCSAGIHINISLNRRDRVATDLPFIGRTSYRCRTLLDFETGEEPHYKSHNAIFKKDIRSSIPRSILDDAANKLDNIFEKEILRSKRRFSLIHQKKHLLIYEFRSLPGGLGIVGWNKLQFALEEIIPELYKKLT